MRAMFATTKQRSASAQARRASARPPRNPRSLCTLLPRPIRGWGGRSNPRRTYPPRQGTPQSLAREGRAPRDLVERSGRAEAGAGREAPDGVRRARGGRHADVVAEESAAARGGGIGQVSHATEPALPAEGDATVHRGDVAHGHPRADILQCAVHDEDRPAVRSDPRREAVAGFAWRDRIHQAEWPPARSPVRRDAHHDVVEPVGAEATVLPDDVQPAGHRVERGRGKPIARPHARRVAALEALDRDRPSEGETAVVRGLRDFFGRRRTDRRVDEGEVAVRLDEGDHPDAPGKKGLDTATRALQVW